MATIASNHPFSTRPGDAFDRMRTEIEQILEGLAASPHSEAYVDEVTHLDVDAAIRDALEEEPAITSEAPKAPKRTHYIPATDLEDVRVYRADSVRPLSTGSLCARMLSDFGRFCVTGGFLPSLSARSDAPAMVRGNFLDASHAPKTYLSSRPRRTASLGAAVRAVNMRRLVWTSVVLWGFFVGINIVLFANGLI